MNSAAERAELWVGAAVLAVAAGFLAWSMAGSGLASRLGGGYELRAAFPNVDGIEPGTDVRVAGVKVGRLKTITIEEGRAVLHLEIDRKAAIPKDAAFSITTSGLIGDTYVKISGGDLSAGVLASGATVTERKDPRMDALIDKADRLMGNAEKMQQAIGQYQ